MPLDSEIVRIQFRRFEDRIRSASGRPFTSFREGLAAEWEGYKESLRQRALEKLRITLMSGADIGRGTIWRMADTTLNTVRTSNGQQITITKKAKELWIGNSELEAHIKMLLIRQEDKCALTGIPLQYDGEHTDHQLLPSLDRIDSDGHYTEGNLRVVCRFVNKWKGDLANLEFVRLLALVRQDEL